MPSKDRRRKFYVIMGDKTGNFNDTHSTHQGDTMRQGTLKTMKARKKIRHRKKAERQKLAEKQSRLLARLMSR